MLLYYNTQGSGPRGATTCSELGPPTLIIKQNMFQRLAHRPMNGPISQHDLGIPHLDCLPR